MLIETANANWSEEHDAAYLWFPGERAVMDGFYHLRGGVCWPASIDPRHSMFLSGFLVLLGVNCRTMAAYCLGIQEFQSVSTVLGSNNEVRFQGVGRWLSQVRANYLADTFYWRGSFEDNRKWLLDLERDAMIDPKPSFAEVIFDDERPVILQAHQWAHTGRLRFAEFTKEGREMSDRLRLAPQHLDTPDPDVWALSVAVAGLAGAPPDRIP